MFGINGGYDTRPMATGNADTGVAVTNKDSVFFQQAAFGLEAVSDYWNLNAYGLIPTGTTEYQLNSVYQGAALETCGVDAGYNITPELMLSAGYYYQSSDLGAADGSGVQGRLAYSINDTITIGGNYSYDMLLIHASLLISSCASMPLQRIKMRGKRKRGRSQRLRH